MLLNKLYIFFQEFVREGGGGSSMHTSIVWLRELRLHSETILKYEFRWNKWEYYDNRGAKIWAQIHYLWTKQIEIQECEKSKFALFCLFFGVLVWKRARDFLLCVAYFLSVIRNAPRGWKKISLTEWPLLAPLWLPHCIVLWLLFSTSDEWTCR